MQSKSELTKGWKVNIHSALALTKSPKTAVDSTPQTEPFSSTTLTKAGTTRKAATTIATANLANHQLRSEKVSTQVSTANQKDREASKVMVNTTGEEDMVREEVIIKVAMVREDMAKEGMDRGAREGTDTEEGVIEGMMIIGEEEGAIMIMARGGITRGRREDRGIALMMIPF